MSRSFIPACAGFGPTFMAIGMYMSQNGSRGVTAVLGILMTFAGAFITSTALRTLFRMLLELERAASTAKLATEKLGTAELPGVASGDAACRPT